jgi:PIN domain nuclease of toxin-antitoxin system
MLLDTNALLWVYFDSPRLWFSSVSVLEITMKSMLGKLELSTDESISEIFRKSGFGELPFRAEHAATVADFPNLVLHDPFDRMLLAQASSEGMPLLTSDATLIGLGEKWVHDAGR